MFYSSILYYPYVGVIDLPWLKNALLFWDKIFIIMPKSFDYKYYPVPEEIKLINKRLIDEGIILPIKVTPDHSAVQTASQIFKERLEQGIFDNWRVDNEGEKEVLFTGLYEEKIDPDLRKLIETYLDIGPNLKTQKTSDKNKDSNKIHYYPRDLVYPYMNLLSSEIAKQERLALGTDDVQNELSMLNISNPIAQNPNQELNTQNFKKGYLSHLILETLDISENDINDVLKFRNKYIDEINKFRKTIGDLFTEIPENATKKDLDLYFRDCWKNEIEPELNLLKKSLIKRNFKTGVSLLKTATLSTASSLFGVAIAGPVGMVVGLTVPIIFELAQNIISNKEKEINNPFSVVMKVQTRHRLKSLKNFIKNTRTGSPYYKSSFPIDNMGLFNPYYKRLGLSAPQ